MVGGEKPNLAISESIKAGLMEGIALSMTTGSFIDRRYGYFPLLQTQIPP